MNEAEQIKRLICEQGRSLYLRGYATGSAGNMSAVLPDGTVAATPTGSCLGTLDPEKLAVVDVHGELLSGPKPTKEVKFHLALYRGNPQLKAIVHLHCTYATALSCLDDLEEVNVIKPFTPYVVMRMGDIPLIPYFKPGSEKLVTALEEKAPGHNAFLLANHGPVVGGSTLTEAVNNIEELEATARLYFTLQSRREHIRYLSDSEIKELR